MEIDAVMRMDADAGPVVGAETPLLATKKTRSLMTWFSITDSTALNTTCGVTYAASG